MRYFETNDGQQVTTNKRNCLTKLYLDNKVDGLAVYACLPPLALIAWERMTRVIKTLILILCACFNLLSQDTPFKLDSKYFLLGTIGDYDGYQYNASDTSCPVTIFLRDDMYKLFLIDSLLKNDTVDYKIEFFGID